MDLDPSYFKYWFDGIVGTCELIASTDAFARAWLKQDTSITSIHYYDELMEQLLGDLHLIEHRARFEAALKRIDALDTISAFSNSLLALQRSVTARAELRDPRVLLASQEWADLQSTALSVISAPAATTYRTGRSDITIPRKPSGS
jgi:hypothetical protein